MEVKKFVKDHKKGLIIGGVVVGTVAGFIILWKVFKVKNPKKAAEIASNTFKVFEFGIGKDLPKPLWEGMEIIEHWSESDGAQNMILNCHVCQLGELGEHLMNDMVTQANPDIPIEMILSYGSSCWVGT